MKDTITFKYKNDFGVDISVAVPGDCNLTELTARFIEFTRMVGYQPGSWENVLEKLNEDGGFDSDFTAYDWADAVMYE